MKKKKKEMLFTDLLETNEGSFLGAKNIIVNTLITPTSWMMLLLFIIFMMYSLSSMRK